MRLIMAEPQTLVRAGLVRLLEQQAGAEVVGEADDGQQLLELAGRLRPDVVVSELALGRMSGLEMLSQLRRHYPEIAVLMISSQLDSHSVRTALKLGAAGFLGKSAEPKELQLALQAVQKGQVYLSPGIAHLAFERRSASQRAEDHVALTPRQKQVLQLIARGRSTKEIASLMGVSIKTVETHRARMMQSLNLYGTNALMRYAIRLGMDSGTL